MPANTTREILANLRKRESELLDELEEVRRVIAAVEPLDFGEQSVNVKAMSSMQPEGRLRRSKAANKKNGDACAAAANAAGMCMSDVARAVGVSQAYLSMVRNGSRTITQATADKIEKLIGFKATKANWPRLTQE